MNIFGTDIATVYSIVDIVTDNLLNVAFTTLATYFVGYIAINMLEGVEVEQKVTATEANAINDYSEQALNDLFEILEEPIEVRVQEFTIRQLKAMASEAKLPRYGNLTKAELIEALGLR